MKKTKKSEVRNGLCRKIFTEEQLERNKTNLKVDIENYLKQIDDIQNNNHLFTGVVFVCFEKSSEITTYYNFYPHSIIGYIYTKIHYYIAHYVLCCLYSRSKLKKLRLVTTLRVEKCPEPNDIIWENLQYTLSSTFMRVINTYLISIILILISFSIILGLNYIQWKNSQQSSEEQNVVLNYFLSLLISITISIINFGISATMFKLTQKEKFNTLTKFYLSLSVKLSMFTFINSAIVPLISNVINYGWEKKDILLNNLLIMFTSNSIVTPLVLFLNIEYFIKKYHRHNLEKDHHREAPIPNLSQKELNLLYENPDMAISYKYSYIVKTILMTFFYLPLFPVGVLFSLIGLILTYQIEKFNLIKIYKRPEMLNDGICSFYVKNFCFALFIYSIGNWIFMSAITASRIWALISICLFGSLSLVPYSTFFAKINCVGASGNDVLTKPYLDCYFDFATDYERENPVTKIKGTRKYIERLKQKGYISEEKYQALVNTLTSQHVNIMEVYYRSHRDIDSKLKEKINKSIFSFNTAKTKKNGMNVFKDYVKNLIGDEVFTGEDYKSKRRNKIVDNMLSSVLQTQKAEEKTSRKKLNLFKKSKKNVEEVVDVKSKAEAEEVIEIVPVKEEEIRIEINEVDEVIYTGHVKEATPDFDKIKSEVSVTGNSVSSFYCDIPEENLYKNENEVQTNVQKVKVNIANLKTKEAGNYLFENANII